MQWAGGIGRKLRFVTHGCHQSEWRWCPRRCFEGPAALSSPASCSGSTGSSCLGGRGQQRLTPAETRNLAGSERCPVRIPAPGEAHRSEIRAVTPPWHRGGCDHNQLSRERLSTMGCTCAPSSGGKNTSRGQSVFAKPSAPDKETRMDRPQVSDADGAWSECYRSKLLLSLLSLSLSPLRADAESHDAFRVLPCCGPAVGRRWDLETKKRRGGLFEEPLAFLLLCEKWADPL